MNHLERTFLQLMQPLGVAPPDATSHLTTLLSHYQQPHRHYHNLSHIKALLQHFDQVSMCLTEPLAVKLAIFYHDIIYDPTRLDNEIKSAELMQQQLAGIVSQPILTMATRLIVMTQKHQLDDSLTPAQRQDASYFLDMDLAILGSEPSSYQKYAQAIRQEYCHMSETLYQAGRCQVLSHFLQRPRLYFSDKFFGWFEHQARHNLEQEIRQLSHAQ